MRPEDGVDPSETIMVGVDDGQKGIVHLAHKHCLMAFKVVTGRCAVTDLLGTQGMPEGRGTR
jgi:hypothetical protein